MRRSTLFWVAVGACGAWMPSPARPGELPTPAAPGTHRLTVRSGGYDRAAMVHIPPGYDPARPPALVLGLHGGGGDGARFLTGNGWADLADAEGFVVVAPDGLPARPGLPAAFRTNPRVWNSGQLPGLSPRSRIDDVAFLGELLDALRTRVPHDPGRVFVAGHSMGAGMGFRVAEELSDRVAALATVAGVVANPRPDPKRPVPTLYIIGTEDPLLPPEGGESKTPWGTRRTPPVAEYLATWAGANGCDTGGTVVSDAAGLRTVAYRPKAGSGPELTAVYVEGHGHAWPGGTAHGLPERVLGPITGRLDATARMWEFFRSVPPRD